MLLLLVLYRVNVPKQGVLENLIGGDNTSRIHEFNKIQSSILEGPLPLYVPQDCSLAINCPFFTYKRTITQTNDFR